MRTTALTYRPTAVRSLFTAHSTLAENYSFSAKERDAETGLSYFGARYYSSDLSVWLSVDPMSDKYPSVSPYVYCADNPVRCVDPNGEDVNPVYDRFGCFLGTDDLGLQGEAIIMDEKDFQQNMSHKTALEKRTKFDPTQSLAAEIRYWSHYSSLKDRPDYDGYLTWNEAVDWYAKGDGQPLFVNLDYIDLSGIVSLGEKFVGDKKSFNLLINSNDFNSGLVYGNITLKRYPNNTVKAFADTFDFEMHSGFFSLGRNFETIIGSNAAGKGKPFEINFYGSTQLKPILPWIK